MEPLIIPSLPSAPQKADEVRTLLDQNHVAWHPLQPNWAANYPYAPQARFRLAARADLLMVDYEVSEDHVRAAAPADNGRVWEDSCCELFVQPGGGHYYNFECNCAGTLLIGCGAQRNNRELARPDVLAGVERYASLGRDSFGVRPQSGPWHLSLIIPAKALFRDVITTWEGRSMRGNVYKCGDLLPRPHFLSWMPVGTETPDFHRPDFFGLMKVE